MKYITSKLFILAAILTVSFFAVSANAQRGFDQRGLEKQVRHQILMLPYYDVFDYVSFNVSSNGTVTLYGQVNEYSTKNGAANRVKRIAGVRNVVNNIEILPLSPSDDRIRRATVRAIASKGGLGGYFQGTNPDMHIIVKRGHITLEGVVRNQSDANLAYIAARGVSGAFSVTNKLISERDRIN